MIINPDLSIIVPTYREVKNIPILAERIHAALNKRYSYEIIVVDDNSSDGTEEVCESLSRDYNLKLFVRKVERGLSSAVIHGFNQAKGTVFFVMDADLSHPAESIPVMADLVLKDGAEFVVGSRNISGGSADTFNLYRKMNAFISRMLARPFARVTDPMAGFFCFPSRLLTENVKSVLNPVGWKIGLELLVKMSPENIREVPIKFADRLHGESKLSFKEQINYLKHLWRLFDYKYRTLKQLCMFSIVGLIGSGVDLASVVAAKSLFQLPFEYARMAGFVTAVTSNFIFNKNYTFKEDKGNVILQYLLFVSSCLVGFAVNWYISVYMYKNYAFFNNHYILAAAAGIIGGMGVNFLMSKFVVFKKNKS